MQTLHPQTLKFLSAIKKNNNREWFEKNKPTYEAIKLQATAVLAALLKEMSTFDSSLQNVDAKKTLMRIYRDVRFSKDKSPYKNNLGAGISSNGKNFIGAGYYVHLQPGACFLGGGIWMPESEALKKIRQEIDYNFNDFRKIIEAPSFKKTFGNLDRNERLSRPPKGYTAENPAVNFLMLKSFTCACSVTDAQALSEKFVKQAAGAFKQMHPFIKFLNQAVE